MTSKEILQANLLDILFENRNKEYGAYPLRKYYNSRLSIALAVAISSIALVGLLIPSPGASTIASLHDSGLVSITPLDFDEPPREELKPVQKSREHIQPVATQQYTTQIQFVSDNVPTDVPPTDQLLLPQIGPATQSGVINPGNQQVDPNQSTGTAPTSQQPADKPFDPVEDPPQFPGGQEAWVAFLRRHLQAPAELEAGERKTVLVKFMVSEDGSITQFEVMQSGGRVFDNEVIRVLKKMPKWKPAIQNGNRITVSFTQPVTFQGLE